MLLAFQTEPAPSSGGLSTILLFGGMFVVYYFLFVRPQRRRQQERLALARAVEIGDRVRTASGLHGTVVSVTDDTVVLRLTEGRAEFDRRAIAQRLADDDAS
ncbi:MAG: preprotein translocase subunit YajC [Acidimicrobiia bacterium]|nr:preprotein translocase subunit YajC [Acidimicrobiia bacterium]